MAGGRRRRAGRGGGSFLNEKKMSMVFAAVLVLDVGVSWGLFAAFGAHFCFDLLQCAGLELAASFVRVAALVGLVLWAKRKGKPPPPDDERSDHDFEVIDDQADDNAGNDDHGGEMMELLGRNAVARRDTNASGPKKSYAQRVKLSERIKLTVLILCFIVPTISLASLGAKAAAAPLGVGRNGTMTSTHPTRSEDSSSVHSTAAVVMILLLIFVFNLELYVSRNLVHLMTKEEGVFCSRSHPHVLNLRRDIGWTRCDRCRLRVVESTCYNCALCDFDVCHACLKKDVRFLERRAEEEEAEEDHGNDDEGDQLTPKLYWKHLFEIVRPHVFFIFVAIGLVVTKQALFVVIPSYTGRILDSLIGQDVAQFRHLLTVFVIVNVALGILSGCARTLFAAIGARLDFTLKSQIHSRILDQEMPFFDSSTTGDLLAKLQEDSRIMLSPVKYVIASFFSAVLSLVGGLIMCLRTSWRLSVLAFTVLGPLTMIQVAYSSWASNLWSKVFGLNSSLSESAKESFTLIRTVRAFGRESNRVADFDRILAEKKSYAVKDALASGVSSLLSEYLKLALQVLVLTFGGIAILDGDSLTVGDLIVFQLYWQMLSGAITNIFDQTTSLVKGWGAAQRVIRLLNELPSVDVNAGLDSPFPADIELRDVYFRYESRPEQMILKGMNLKIEKGSVVALVGRSGGGKSTCISLLCGNYRPTRGTILVGGRDLCEFNMTKYRADIGLVQQDTELFNTDIEANITFGLTGPYSREDLETACRQANCLEFIQSFEDGFATTVGERGVKLSGGQKQRLALARALIKRPRVLLLDEATSNLDAESEALVQRSIDELLFEKDNGLGLEERPTVILIAHRLSTVINADLIAVVDGGRIAEQGTHAQLLEAGGIYASLVQRQLTTFDD